MDIAIVVLIITGLVQVLKKAVPNVTQNVAIIVPLALGLVAGLLFIDAEIGVQVFSGLAIGLASMGVFDISKLLRPSK